MPDLLVGHHPAQPVGAEEQSLAGRQPLLEQVGLHPGLIADDAVDDVFLRVVRCLLRRDLACGDETLDQRVVGGDLHDTVLFEQIGATVTGVGDGRPVADEERHHQRGAHIGAGGPALFVDGPVGGLGRGGEPLIDLRQHLAGGRRG